MIWVVVCALIVSMGLNVLLSVLFARQASRASALLDRAHARTTEYTGGLIDRLMSQDWVTYKAYEIEPEEEEPIPPTELVAVRGPDRGGFGSRLGLLAYRSPEEDIEAMENEIP